jgi:hypothetical protein
LVRRLWGEEITDAILQSSNIPTTFGGRGDNGAAVTWAMQISEPQQETAFQQAFLIGNRDDQPRSTDGNIQQALAMMNDGTNVMPKLAVTGAAAAQGLVMKSLALSNDDAVTNLYLNILSRYPTDAERKSGVAYLSKLAGTNRNNRGAELAWTLYNKVDFIFNY